MSGFVDAGERLVLSTGRIIEANHGAIALNDVGGITAGFDEVLEAAWMPGTDSEEFTDAERVEIADHVIARWQEWRDRWAQKIAEEQKHEARVEEARQVVARGDWERFKAMVQEDMAAAGVVEVSAGPASPPTVHVGLYALPRASSLVDGYRPAGGTLRERREASK